jgi:predicted transcriptional regulator
LSDDQSTELVALTANITAAYLAGNKISASHLPGLVASIHHALTTVASGSEAKPPEEAKAPAVPIRRSITPERVVCLEDGQKFTSLKRHLRTKHNLSPQDYRAKWGLPNGYPMVAPNCSAQRSALATSMGLGQGGRKPLAAKPVVAPKPTTAVKRAPKARGKAT